MFDHFRFLWILIIIGLISTFTTLMFPQLPTVIPRKILFGNPERTSPGISPDGKMLAYIAPKDNVLNVWVRTLGKDDDRVVTWDKKRGIRQYFWAEDNLHLIYLQDKDGDENWHLYSVDLATNQIKDITAHEGVQARVVHSDPAFPDVVLVSMNIRDKRLHDVYKINLTTGEEQLVVENPGDVLDWIVDNKMQVRGSIAQTPDGGFILKVRDDVKSEWKTLAAWSSEEGLPNVYGFTPDNLAVYVGDPRDWNSTRLVEIALSDGSIKLLASDPEYDAGDVIVHPTGHYIQAVSFYKDRNLWTVLDTNIDEDFKSIKKITDGDFGIVSRNNSDDLWIVGFTKDNGPVPFYFYDRKTKKSSFIFTNRPELEKYNLAPMKPISLKARDGLILHGYMTLPLGMEPKNLPLVCNVHGGPWARDVWGWNSEAQWFANRGYACLQINFRGSTGYGKKFLNAGDREWGAKMHDDVIDAVTWAVTEGYADPKRVSIYGGSYGGYAALAGAAFTPDFFACAVDIVGPSNILTLIRSIPPYWEPLKKMFTKRVGDPDKEEEFLKLRSPLFSADKIKIPMLIAQGANDPRVKQSESEQIVDALKKKGKDVEYMLFPDEGHGFARPENRLKFYEAAEKFLAKHLGGRTEEAVGR